MTPQVLMFQSHQHFTGFNKWTASVFSSWLNWAFDTHRRFNVSVWWPRQEDSLVSLVIWWVMALLIVLSFCVSFTRRSKEHSTVPWTQQNERLLLHCEFRPGRSISNQDHREVPVVRLFLNLTSLFVVVFVCTQFRSYISANQNYTGTFLFVTSSQTNR